MLVPVAVILFAAANPPPITGISTNAPSTNIVVRVTASPIAQAEAFTPDGADTVVVGRGQLDRLSAQDLPTALRHVPGVSVSRYSPIGSYGGAQGGSVYVRGTGESRPGGSMTVYQDGVPVMSGFFNHPLMDLVPVDFADSITVTKTPRPRTVTGAFSAIDLETLRRRVEGYEGALETAYGRFSTLMGSVTGAAKDGPVDAAAGISYRYSEGARDHSAAELRNAFARGGVDLGSSDYLTFIYHRTENYVQDPGEKGSPTPVRDQFNTDSDSYTMRLESDHEYLKGSSAVYFVDGQIRWHKDHLTDGNLHSPPGWANTDWHSYGYRGLYDIPIDDFTLSLGLDEMVESGRTRNINETTGRTVWAPGGTTLFTTAPYAGLRYDWHLTEDWTVTPSVGARYYFTSDYEDEWTPSAALNVGRKEYGLFASYSEGVHYPGPAFRAVSAATWSTLEAERMRTTEFGARGSLEDIASVHAAFYHNQIEDRFDQTSRGYLNVGSLHANGFEATIRFMPTNDLSFFVGAAYTIPETHPVSRLPEVTGSVGASWRIFEHLHLDADAEYVSSQYAYSSRAVSVADLEKVAAYWTANTRLALDLRAFCPLDGEIYVSGENIFNRHYEYFPGYPMPGAMMYTGIKVRF